jgi:hypothetical protein
MQTLALVPGVPGEECVEFLDLFSDARQCVGGGVVGLTGAHFASNYLAAFQLTPLVLEVCALVSAPANNIIQ